MLSITSAAGCGRNPAEFAEGAARRDEVRDIPFPVSVYVGSSIGGLRFSEVLSYQNEVQDVCPSISIHIISGDFYSKFLSDRVHCIVGVFREPEETAEPTMSRLSTATNNTFVPCFNVTGNASW